MYPLDKRSIFLSIGIAIFYFATAIWGLSWAVDGTTATPLWPPAGIAVAALFAFGPRVWPSIFVGALVANLTHLLDWNQIALPQTIAVSSTIAFGNLLEGLFLYFLCRRFVRSSNPFDEPTHIFKFVLIAGLSCLISGSIGALSMHAVGLESSANAPEVFITWWLGDLLAIFIVAPFLLSWWPLPQFHKGYKWRELLAAFGSIIILCEIVFGGHLALKPLSERPYVFIPVLLWLAFRFSRRELVTGVSLITGIAIFATANNQGPFAAINLTESFLSEQVFCAMIAITMLVLSAVIGKTANYQKQLKEANEELENRVEDRTRALKKKALVLEAINNQLRIEVRERLAVENQLRSLQSKDS